jgi:uncharacterized protein YfdQ (DUF2303 family)
VSEVESIVEVALASAVPQKIDPDAWYVITTSEGGVHTLAPRPDHERATPRRATGSVVVYDADSFYAYWSKHAVETSEVYADPKRYTVTAVLDAHGGAAADAGHGQHRVTMVCEQTPAWKAWAALDGRLVDQAAFAEHIENRAVDVQSPTAAEMLELAQTFEATTKVDFKSVDVISSGQRGIRYEETTAAKAGQTGQIEIPATFQIAVQPFEGSPAYRLNVRFRYRIRDGRLQIGYALERPEDTLREAFNDVVEVVSQAVDVPVLSGVPMG